MRILDLRTILGNPGGLRSFTKFQKGFIQSCEIGLAGKAGVLVLLFLLSASIASASNSLENSQEQADSWVEKFPPREYIPTEPLANLPVVTRSLNQINPAVAYNSQSSEYLVVWEEVLSSSNHDIYAQWFSSSGASVGGAIGIATSSQNQRNPTVAYASATNQFLIVWQETVSLGDDNIIGRRLGVSGLVGDLIYISLDYNYDGNPDVAYNQTSAQYLIVWERLSGGTQANIRGQRINTNGTLAVSGFWIDEDANDESVPVVVNWETAVWSGYLVAWQDKQTEYDIHAQQVRSDGVLTGSEVTVVSWQYDQLKPKIACADKCLLVWEDHHWAWGSDSDIYAQRYVLNTSGLLQADGGNFGISWESDLKVNPVVYYRECGSDYLVYWEQKTASSNLGIYERAVLANGTLVGAEVAVSAEPHYEGNPAVAIRLPCTPFLVWEDDRNSASTGMDLYGSTFAACSIHCQCAQGEFCYKGWCIRDPKQDVYCCAKSGCPPGAKCITTENTASRCAEDPTYHCENACDCGPAHCCKNNLCVKDVDDPWLPGGTEVGPSCVSGIDPTYCCAYSDCLAGRSYYGDNAVTQFRCLAGGNEVRSYCGGNRCYGTSCNCSFGDVCVDSIAENSPAGKTCFLKIGGTCFSGATAEAVFGWAPGEIIHCEKNISAIGSPVDFGWKTLKGFSFQRTVGSKGSCGNGVCNPGEYPGSCPADCRCGDGVCAPSELSTCSSDCGTCGDGLCRDWESPYTCPRDCKPSSGDGYCQMDEFWSDPADCGCPDAAYYPQIFAACGDSYYPGASSLNPETCDSCLQEVPPAGSSSEGETPSADPQLQISKRHGGSTGALVEYFAPDIGRSVLVKGSKIYLTGQTFTSNFPAIPISHFPGWNAFAARLNTSGDIEISRVLGAATGLGHANYTGRDIAVDSAGNLYIAGSMGVVSVTPNGSSVSTIPNTIFGSDGAYAISLDASNYIYIAGSTSLGAMKLRTNGAVLYHNTTLGGKVFDIALDSAGSAYLAGAMGYIRLDASGNSIASKNLFGTGYGIAYRNSLIYITGSTYSSSFPTTSGAFDTTADPKGDAFLIVLNPNGNVVYATFLGGSGFDEGRSVAVDNKGRIYLTGYTYSSNYPTTMIGTDPTLTGIGDAFVAVIDPQGKGASDLVYATYLGGNDPVVPPYLMPDRGLGIALDAEDNVYITGESGSPDFPTSWSGGFSDAFLVKLKPLILDKKIFLPIIRR